MNGKAFPLISIILLICVSAALGQTAVNEDALLKEAALKTSTEYAQMRNLDAQDKIVNPDEYVVGPGDEFTIFSNGAFTHENRLQITPEGSILIPEFGDIYLGQITLQAAKEKILQALKTRYQNVTISVTLSKLRRLKVSVDGAVMLPGIYTVTSMDRVSECVKLAGGFADGASQRNIRLFRGDSIINVDHLLFARGGDAQRNPYTLEGDRIFVPPQQNNIDLVEIYGAVKLPGQYEFVSGDRVSDLMLLAGGITLDANLGSAELARFANSGDSILMMPIKLNEILANPNSSANLFLLPDDRLFIRSFADFHPKSQIKIQGEVKYPGVYVIKEDTTTLTEIIEAAGGFTPTASLDEARMFRSGYEAMKDTELDRQLKLSVDKLSDIEREYLMLRSDPEQGRISIDFGELFEKGRKELDVTLKNNDLIVIPKLSSAVRIIGRVLKSGLVTYSEGADVNYYISKAGGFTKTADKGKIRIIKGVSGAITKPSRNVKIEVGDMILVPEKIGTNWWAVTKDVGTFLANMATVYIVIDQILK